MSKTPLLSLLENVRKRAEQSIREKLPTDDFISPTFKKASAPMTRKATSQAMTNIDSEVRQKSLKFTDQLSKSGAMAEFDDGMGNLDAMGNYGDGNIPEQKEPGTELANISKEIANFGDIEPEWHAVKNLPGYISAPIRAMGRAIFSQFTNTPIEEIYVIANLQNGGPNSDVELAVVARYMRKYGNLDQEMTLDFEQSIPGYSGDVKIYKTNDFTFCVVVDFMGKYVYAWPTSDEIDRLN